MNAIAEMDARTHTVPRKLARLAGRPLVILVGQFERGGAQRQAFLLARELRLRHGLDARVWALVAGTDYWREFEAAGIPTKVLNFQFPHYGWPKRCWPVLRELRKAKVGILLPFTTWPNVVAGLTYRLSGIGLCIWCERHSGGERVPFMEHVAATQYRRFVANSSAGVEFLAAEMKVPRERISFIPNGIEPVVQAAGRDWRNELSLDSGQKLVVKVANLTTYKDHITLLHAWKIVQDSWGDEARPVLALAGLLGDNYQACLRTVEVLGIDSTVRFLGQITDVPGLIEASDLAVFSSRKEGMPNGVLECMAAGKPVVATDIPGVRDALGPNVSDILAPPGEPAEFARIVLDLLHSQEKREALATVNRQRIQAEFSPARMAESYLEVIRAELVN